MQQIGFLVVGNKDYPDFHYPLVLAGDDFIAKSPGFVSVPVCLKKAKKEGAKLVFSDGLEAVTKARILKVWSKR